MTQAVTEEEFLTRLSSIHGDKISYITGFDGLKLRVKVKCNTCSHEWEPFARKLVELNPTGCAKCSSASQETTLDSFIESTSKKRNDLADYEITEYVRHSKNMKVTHKVCGHSYSILPSNFARGSICPMCCKRPVVTNDSFINRVKNVHGLEYVVLDEYQSAHKKLRILHTTCNQTFEKTPVNFLKPQGCPFCKQLEMESAGERAIREWLEANNISFQQQFSFEDDLDFRNKRLFSFDFCINYNGSIMLVEYFGELHYRMFNKDSAEKFESQKKRDELKASLCKEKNIPLLVIPYTEIKSIPTLLESFIKG